MNAYRQVPRRSRGPVVFGRRSSLWILAVALVATLELAGTLAVPAGHPGPVGPPAATGTLPVAPASAAPAAITTHGDLNVAAGKTVYLPATHAPSGQTLYYQGGNISVAATGKLVVTNTTLSMVQFIGTSGVPAVRLSHVFRIVNHGTIVFRNSTLTTTTFQVNPYPKLMIINDGVMSFWNSSIRSAGLIQVGTGGVFTLNGSSALRPNANASLISLPKSDVALASDLRFASTLAVSGGGQANLFSSVYTGLDSDNLSKNLTPGQSLGPRAVNATDVLVQNGQNWTSFRTGTTPISVLEDYLYPQGISGGSLDLSYTDTNPVVSTASWIKVWYGPLGYGLGRVIFPANTTGNLSLPLPANLTAAINAGGMEGWLNHTGAFGTASGMSVAFHVTAGPALPGVNLSFHLQPLIHYGPTVSGAGSRLSVVNSFVALNFSGPSRGPWTRHNLTVSGGATAYLANLTMAGALGNNTTQYTDSAIQVSGGSHVYLYRWAEVQLTGRNHVLPVPNATLTEDYAYGLPQTDNTTAQTLNALKTADPAIYGYLQYWQSAHSIAAYGKSNTNGVASLLLASNDIYAGSAPGGDFLGDYHVTVTPPLGIAGTRGFNVTLPSYPIGVAARSAGYGEPTSWGKFSVPGYFAQATLGPGTAVVVTANGVPATTIHIGQVLGVTINVVSTGTAPITTLQGSLLYNNTVHKPVLIASTLPIKVHLGPGGAPNATVKLLWTVNETVVGHHGKAVADSLAYTVVWNLAKPVLGGGNFSGTEAVQFAPSFVGLSDLSTTDASCLSAGNTCFTSAVIAYNGTEAASVTLTANPTGGGTPVQLGYVTTQVAPGKNAQSYTARFSWVADLLTPGVTYVLTVTGSYNGVSVSKTLATQYTVPTSSPSSNIWSKKFLGEPLWVWLAIVAAVIVAIVAFLLFSRRQAAGKLVECGECGNLIPEEAKVCPKCGAEFESDVIRCSRCSSTIPADSKFCPECAAQLLGKPGEGGIDPERQAYSDFTERFRAEAKKELGENYSEGAFWDWWKRQPSYTPFSQWKLQQGQGTPRSGMTAPPGKPPASGAAPARPAPKAARPSRGAPPPPAAQPPAREAAPPPPAAAAAPEPTPGGALKPCPNCGKEIPPEYLVCPFCGSVTQ